jgi:hypothetical protein
MTLFHACQRRIRFGREVRSSRRAASADYLFSQVETMTDFLPIVMTRCAFRRSLALACRTLWFCAAGVAFAGELHAEGLTGEVQFISARSRNTEEQKSLSQVSVYLEKTITSDVSAFVSGYHDPEFRSTTVGLGKKFDDVQIGFDLGQATYGGTNHLVVNPWLYYSTDSYQGYLHAEYYRNGLDQPRFFKGYLQRTFGPLFVGAYGETNFGFGPRIGVTLPGNVKTWVNLPMTNRPAVGAMEYMGGMSVEF